MDKEKALKNQGSEFREDIKVERGEQVGYNIKYMGFYIE